MHTNKTHANNILNLDKNLVNITADTDSNDGLKVEDNKAKAEEVESKSADSSWVKRNYPYIVLVLIFILALSIRLYFAFSTPNFTGSDSYFVLRQVKSIVDTGFPIFNDPLSYGGRYHIFLPLFHYMLAFFSLFMSIITVCKLIPNIAAATVVFGVFLLVRHITKDVRIALYSALISGFVPIYISETVNTVSVYSFTIPITIFLMYFFLKINIKKNSAYFIIFLLMLIMLDFSSYILIAAILLYLILAWTENLIVGRSEIELALFSVFIMTFLYVSMFSDAFQIYGSNFIWQNIPASLLASYFSDVNLIDSVYAIGIIPAIFGVIAILIHLFRKKKLIYLPVSFSIILSVLLGFKLVPLKFGLMLLGLIFVILFGDILSIAVNYFNRTKFKRWWPIYLPFLILFIISSVVPSMTLAKAAVDNAISDDEISAFKTIKSITPPDSTIIGTVEDGNLIVYFSSRKDLIDTNFLMATDSEERLSDLKLIYTSAISSKAIEIMDFYSADYIILNRHAMEDYNISSIAYVDNDCFPLVYNETYLKVYKKKCKLS
jgi:hypothetical protein